MAEDSRELVCWSAFRDARAEFQSDLIAHAQAYASGAVEKLSRDDFMVLRGEHAYAIAEFYYLAEENGLANKAKMRMVLNRHNEDMNILSNNKDNLSEIGLTPQRISQALFSDPQIENVVENIVDGRLRLDQTALAKILATIISTETVRKTVVVLAKGGLLSRINTGNVLLISNGSMEKYFKKHLTAILGSLKQQAI